MDDAGLHDRLRPHVADDLGQAFQAVADQEEHVPHAAVAQVGEHAHPELRALAAGAGPQPEDVLVAVQGDPDRGVDRPVGDLPVADLDHDRVDEHRRVDLVQRPGAPSRVISSITLSVIREIVSLLTPTRRRSRRSAPRSPRWSTLSHTATTRSRRHRTAAAAASSRSAARTCPPGPAARRSRTCPVARSAPSSAGCRCGRCPSPGAGRVVLLVPEVLGHLLVQRGLQHGLGELLQQPVRAGQRQALLLGQPDQLLRRASPPPTARPSSSSATSSSVAVITAPSPPTSRSACQAGNTVRSTVPVPVPERSVEDLVDRDPDALRNPRPLAGYACRVDCRGAYSWYRDPVRGSGMWSAAMMRWLFVWSQNWRTAPVSRSPWSYR